MLRIISAVIGISITLWIMYLGTSLHFLIFLLIITALASYEYFKLLQTPPSMLMLGVALSAIIPLFIYMFQPFGIMHFVSIVVILFLTFRVIKGPIHKNNNWSIREFFLGILYVGLLSSYFISLRKGENGANAVMFVLCTMWFCDTAAYYMGKKYGKRPLASAVSPKKTWEGAFAGLVASGVGALFLGICIYPQLSLIGAFMAGIIISLTGQIGDLAESLIKREYGVKDSGILIPGHGGVLDRIDSQLFAAPVFYMFIHYIV